MSIGPMKILVIEDDIDECNNFIKTIKGRNDFDLVGITDSDVDALRFVKLKHPEGIVLDIELNNSSSGSTDSLDFLDSIKSLKLNYSPIIIVTTHITSKRTYEILHRKGVDIILYKDHPTYSIEHVLNKFLALRTVPCNISVNILNDSSDDVRCKFSDLIYHELDLIGITPKLKGRAYVYDAILYILENPNSNVNVIQYLSKVHKKSGNTITNGIQNAIIHAWRVSAIEDLELHYTAKVNYETGIPTPMEFIYYYVDKIKKLV